MIRFALANSSNKRTAKISSIGQVITAPYAYDEVVFKELATDNTAYNFFKPKSGQQFVITGMVAKADKQVSSTVDADVVVYEATSPTTVTVSKTLFQTAMVQGDQLPLLPLNILVKEGRFINAKTSDDDIHMTIMGYYVDKIS